MGQPRVTIMQEDSNFAGNISPGSSVVLGCKYPMGDGNNKAYVGTMEGTTKSFLRLQFWSASLL